MSWANSARAAVRRVGSAMQRWGAGGGKQQRGIIGFVMKDDDLSCEGYTRLCDNPQIQTACLRIAELIASMTIHLMANTDDGDERIVNELSRKIDIEPCGTMTRSQWMTLIVMNMLLYGRGNAIVVPHTYGGILDSLEPIAWNRVSFQADPVNRTKYTVLIDGVPRDPEELLHFRYNPDPNQIWRGQGVQVTLKEIADNLKQGQKTVNAFMKSEWKPSIIVKVDGLTEEFASPEGRTRLLESYIHPNTPGEPWMIPSEAFSVEQVRPLSLGDLAIKDTMEMDIRTVAAVIGVPPFLLGIGEFKRDEWNNFIQTKIRSIAQSIQQELTRGLIISPKWYLRMNLWSLMDYDLKSISDILLAGADRGYVNGDEWRDRMNMAPAGLKEYRVLENYIPTDMAGLQKKLVGND